jgi:Zn-dependent M16 (insulinase) family peptidase
MSPDDRLGEKEVQTERQRMEEIRQRLSAIDRVHIIEQAQALRTFQEKIDTADEINVLPKIALQDVPKKAQELLLTKEIRGNVTLFHHNVFTNALTYVDLILPLPEITGEELWLVRLLTTILPQVGAANRSYAENLEYIQEHTGGISAGLSVNHQVYDCNVITPTLHIRGKALDRKAGYLFRLLFDVITAINCTEKNRIQELIFKHYTNLQSSFTQNAIKYATNLSASGLNTANYLNNAWYGLEYFHRVKKLYENFDKCIDDLVSRLEALQKRLLSVQGAHLVVCCDQTAYSKYLENDFDGLIDLPGKAFTHWSEHFAIPKSGPQARVISSPVAFSARAFQIGSYGEALSPAICLAANLFENKTLHKRIREQGGAYGGGTSYNPTSGTFYFYSYRDPNICSTIAAFDEAIGCLLAGDFDSNDLEEAKLEMVQALDAPIAPGSRAEVAYSRFREGKTTEMRQAFRDRLLGADHKQVIQATEQIAAAYRKSNFITFAGKQLIERENKKLPSPLPVRQAMYNDL